MVFQSYALYPHMTVAQNMGFSMKLRKMPPADVEQRVTEAATILGLSQLLHRTPKELSGGQRQRVAMGRAIVRSPKVFLFDEPLSNLDAKLRISMRTELKALHQRLLPLLWRACFDARAGKSHWCFRDQVGSEVGSEY